MATADPKPAVSATPPAPVVRVRAFVDFWNFQLSVRENIRKDFPLDWKRLGPWLVMEAGRHVLMPGDLGSLRYEGMNIYLSYNPTKAEDAGLKKWALGTVDRFPGVRVTAMERKPKGPSDCPTCHAAIEVCPHCKAAMRGTIEKGVDTAIVTDMIQLAWEDSYDIAVLVTSDRDFIPAVEFLASKGKKIVHAGFPPRGLDLARRCWASFDMKAAKLPER
jgi:uncharacterized LabA/DUF88 family protein